MTSQEATAAPAAGQYELSHLRSLEAEAIHIIREVAAEFERPVLLFSGGKDSIVMLHLALKAFRPGRLPFPVMHVDTGHNFDEVIASPRRVGGRDRRATGDRQASRTTSTRGGWSKPSRRATQCRP